MKDSIKNRKKKLLALCLSAMMFSSVAALAACKKSSDSTDSSSSSSTTEEVKDNGLIQNAGFETFDESNAITTSVTGWTKTTTSISGSNALSSKAASGIIDLDKDAWHNLTGSNVDVSTLSEADAESKWDELTVKDKLAYYELWKEQNDDKKIAESLDFYETLNIDSGDIPTVEAFDTHDGAVKNNETATEKQDTRVLMIHNQYPEEISSNVYKALGTGQQYTSTSTVTVKAGTSAEFSVWVKTANLQCSATDGSIQEAVDKGAFISITHSVGSKSMDAYKIENINTERMGVTDNNGWKQYSFLLKGSSYADTTFTLVLGLGQGSMNYRGEYVNGYAFFDDIECNAITNEEYLDKVQEPERKIADADIINFHHEGKEKIVDAATEKSHFALDFFGDFTTLNLLNAIDVAPTETDGYTSITAPWWEDGGTDATKDVTEVFSNAAAVQAGEGLTDAQKAELSKLYNQYLKEDDTFADKQTLLLMSSGTAYTAKATAPIAFNDPDFYLDGERTDYLAISFFVKTSAMQGYTGAGATLVDGKNKYSFESVDTTTMDAVEVNDNKLYGDWQQYFFFVKNAAEEGEKDTTEFTLQFNFGPTSIEAGSNKTSYFAGFAAFANFSVRPLSKAEYDSAQAGTQAKVVSVGMKDDGLQNETSFDTPQGTPAAALEKGLARPKNYMGVYADSAYVTGSGDTQIHANENAGLIAKEHFTAEDGYFKTASGTDGYAWLDGVKTNSGLPATATAAEVWDSVFGNSMQPLLIYTKEQTSSAYGYIGTSKELAVNTYTAISVRVRGEGKAYIRLVDTDASHYTDFKAYNKPLSVGGYLTFWYNDDGNICTADPENDKTSQVAFKLQTNGLYKANKRGWDGYANLENKEAWYANLSAYTETDEKGNLLVAKGGATHDYNKYWNNAGMNGIAFYYDKANDRYCADEALKIPVLDLAKVPNLTHRYESVDASGYTLEAQVDALQDEWTTVTFYVHTGDQAKNYRLEVWSGYKDGDAIKGNGADTYLVFDYNSPESTETNFNGLIEEYKDNANVKSFESVFSYFDTASYLRYNKDLDENKIGNLYEENYTPSANESGVAYLENKSGNYVEIFADYQYSEKVVVANETEEDAEEESTSSSDDDGTNVWLLASSLAIAGVLILAVLSILIRKVFLKGRKGAKKEKKNKKNND